MDVVWFVVLLLSLRQLPTVLAAAVCDCAVLVAAVDMACAWVVVLVWAWRHSFRCCALSLSAMSLRPGSICRKTLSAALTDKPVEGCDLVHV